MNTPEYTEVLKLQAELQDAKKSIARIKARLSALRFPCVICKAMILPGDTCEGCEREGC
jgi:hypothetical protein